MASQTVKGHWRKLWRNKFFIPALVVSCLGGYLFLPTFLGLSPARILDIREKTIRWVYHHNHSGIRDTLEVCYIGIGRSFDIRADDLRTEDPAAELLSRLRDLEVPCRPLSEWPGKERNRERIIVGAGDVSRISLGVVRSKGSYYVNGLNAGAYDVYFLWVPFRWVPVCWRMLWIS
ncbi:MAG: hypothetical protein V2A58_01155 [Planctomycetota bacterium]